MIPRPSIYASVIRSVDDYLMKTLKIEKKRRNEEKREKREEREEKREKVIASP